MAGFWALIHVLRLVLDLARRFSDWAGHQKVRRRTIDELRLRSKASLQKARRARRAGRARRSRGAAGSERLREDDGFRRD